MKKVILSILLTLSAGLLLTLMPCHAQTAWHDAAEFPLLGKISDATETRYERLPVALKAESRPPVWDLGKNTAGLSIRFRTNSTQVAARWTSLAGSVMNHMALTGIRGLDLYCLDEGVWRYAGTGCPATGKTTEKTLVGGMTPAEREFILFLSLYDGITSLEIGIDSNAVIMPPQVALPQTDKPVVAYGTSILQGGCASRPGMAHTNILTRRLSREVINLGFSGNGQLDYEIARLMASCDASLYILDFAPNCTPRQIDERGEPFFRILRDAHPGVPVLFVEDPRFPHGRYNWRIYNQVKGVNEALHRLFDRLQATGEPNIRLLTSDGMTGTDGEEAVDGVHYTDLGFIRYAETLYPVIREMTAR